MYKLIVQVTKDNDPSTKEQICLGVFPTMEAAMAAGRRDILRYVEEENTNIEIKNHAFSHTSSVGSVCKFTSLKSLKVAEWRYYSAERVECYDEALQSVLTLYRDEKVAEKYPGLNAMLCDFLMKEIAK